MSAAITKLTPWFPGDMNPARPGVYQQRDGFGREIGYQRWDGFRWYIWYRTPQKAADSTTPAALSGQFKDWRGLAQPTTTSKP
jgi:hypothetical protein